MCITHAVAGFLNHCRQRRRAAPTIDLYRYQLEVLRLGWRRHQCLPDAITDISLVELQAYLDYLTYEHVNRRSGQVGLAAETRASAWRVLRAFWYFAQAQGWLDASQHAYFQCGALRPPPRVLLQPSTDRQSALPALLAACAQLADPEERARNRAVLRLVEAGLRPWHIAALTDEVWDRKERRARLSCDGRAVVVRWDYAAAVALRAYACVRSGPPGGSLFRNLCSHGESLPLSASAVRRLVGHMAKLAGITPPPHT